MVTIKQKRVARKLVNAIRSGESITKGELLKSVGYSPVSAHNAHQILESQGVQQELEKYGFTADNAKKVLAGILNSPTVFEMVTPDNQIRAAQEVFKIHGSYAPEKHENRNINVNVQFDGTFKTTPETGGDN